jgi:hypothetical protein
MSFERRFDRFNLALVLFVLLVVVSCVCNDRC